MQSEFQAQYEAQVASGQIEPDSAQAEAVTVLGQLSHELGSWRPGRGGLLAYLGGSTSRPPAGLYIHGKVGRGKTMLMDLFFESAPVKEKRRLHFHQFMAETHDMIADARKNHSGDPLPIVAERISQRAALLCFDELHITDIADAMILGRLFNWLWQGGVVVVATSNAAPRELYRHGLNRELFLPFVDLIEHHMKVIQLDAKKDFRLEKLAGTRRYFSPVDAAAQIGMDQLWQELTGGQVASEGAGGASGAPASQVGAPQVLRFKGRELIVPQAALRMARFHFDDLCVKPLGTLDYLQIARQFHTVFIDEVPRLTPEKRNEARRFINLIDTLYDHKISLVLSAETEAQELYEQGDGADLFERTASRLIEMRSDEYLSQRQALRNAEPSHSHV